MSKIRYYITGHGLGHASRSCQIINCLRRRHPKVLVEVVSDAHSWFFEGFLDSSVPVRRRKLDIGVLQLDSLIMRERETLEAYRAFLREKEALVSEEADDLRRHGVDLVAADIPPAAFAAARRAGVPSVGISNFSWDWIYRGLAEKFPGFDDVLQDVEGDYQTSDRLLRLPFHGDLSVFPRIEDLPLVARKSTFSKKEIRVRLGIPEKARVGLISFGGFGLGEYALAPLGAMKNWIFLAEPGFRSPPVNLLEMAPGTVPYPDLVRAADAVITKPGYGIVSEAIANDTAVLYTHRGDFREQAVLVEALHRYARSRKIDNERLRRGEWRDSLEALLAQPEPAEGLAADGDEVAAARLAELVDG